MIKFLGGRNTVRIHQHLYLKSMPTVKGYVSSFVFSHGPFNILTLVIGCMPIKLLVRSSIGPKVNDNPFSISIPRNLKSKIKPFVFCFSKINEICLSTIVFFEGMITSRTYEHSLVSIFNTCIELFQITYQDMMV